MEEYGPLDNDTLEPLSTYTSNWTDSTSTNDTVFTENPFQAQLEYIIIPSIIALLCVLAVVINVRILLAVYWVRRPLSPTLYMSLSLALADAYGATLIGVAMVINSLLPKGFGVDFQNNCILLTIESLRLSGLFSTVLHLLALAGNHYLGILCPFRSRRWITHSNTAYITAILWTAPMVYFFTYFSALPGEGYRAESCSKIDTYRFLLHSRFRELFSCLFFLPLLLMFVIYIHIFIIVRRHQANRRWYNRHSRRHMENGHKRGGSKNERNEQQQFDRNLKAIWTTSLILLSYMICFIPGVLFYLLVCLDCVFVLSSLDRKVVFYIQSINMLLIVTKPILNPLIYASRMHEIRVATRRMNMYCRQWLCSFKQTDEFDLTSSGGELTHHRSSFIAGTTIRRNNCSSIHSVHIGNGTGTGSGSHSRSMRRRTDDMMTDL